MKPNLKFHQVLDDEQKLICQQYWQRFSEDKPKFSFKINQIAAIKNMTAFEVRIKVGEWCSLIIDTMPCKSCKQTFPEVSSRADYIKLNQQQIWECSICIENAEAEKKQILQEKIDARCEIIKGYNYEQEANIPRFDTLSPMLRFLLAAVSEFYDPQQKGYIEFNNSDLDDNTIYSPNDDGLFFSTPELTYQVINLLLELNLLLIVPNEANCNDIHWVSYDHKSGQIGLIKQMWSCLAFSYNQSLLGFCIEYTKKGASKRELALNQDYYRFILNLSRIDIVKYYYHLLTKNHLNLIPDLDKQIIHEINLCASTLNLGLSYYVIWRTLMSCQDYATEKNYKIKESTLKKFLSYQLKNLIRKEGSVKPFSRVSEVPQSFISKFMIDDLVGINDALFEIPIIRIVQLIQVQSFDDLAFLSKRIEY